MVLGEGRGARKFDLHARSELTWANTTTFSGLTLRVLQAQKNIPHLTAGSSSLYRESIKCSAFCA